ncbi:diguanylate cyclase [Oxalobacteraceae bacterium OTU3REALA1]|nr:diguanylate cyclase [Oxalobacteraceae bacterium OTU3REALA1]
MAVFARLPRSLKFRMTGVVVMLVLAATMTVAWVALVLAERDMKSVIGDQQYALLSSAAAQVDAQFTARKVLLASLADTVTESDGANPAAMQAFVARHPVARERFLNLHIYNRQGALLNTGGAVGDGAGGGVTALDPGEAAHAWFERALAAGKPAVSPPFKSILTGRPAIMIVHPVLDAGGRALMLLCGSIDLSSPSFTEQVAAQKPGKTGYTYMMTANGVVLHHPNASLLLKRVDERPGHSKATALAMTGFEGWTETVGRDGVPGIYSFKRLRATDWIIGARFPVEEAFAPMIAMRHKAMLGAAAFAALAGLMAWLAVQWMLRPLGRLRGHIDDIRGGRADIGVLQRGRADEIGALSVAFHELMAEREAAQTAIRDSEALISSILERAPDAFVSCEATGIITKWNAAAERSFGWTREEAIGRDIAELIVPPAMRGKHGAGMRSFADGHAGRLINSRVRVAALHKDGSEVPVELSLGALRHDGAYYATAFLHDITERVAYERKIAASEKRLRTLADNLPVLISYLDHARTFQFLNATFLHWFGMDPVKMIGRHLVEGIGNTQYALAQPHLDRAYQGHNATYEHTARIDGGEHALETTFVPELGADGAVVGIYSLTHDTTRMKEIEQRLTQLARIDTLTGIANRRMFEEILQLAIVRAKRNRKPLALAYLDIDHFKAINDTRGHGAGDAVLKEFAARLTANVRASDTVARVAGDEFIIIFEQVAHAEEAARMALKIVEAIRRPFIVAETAMAVTTSIGLALHHGEGESAAELVARADSALYAAKHNGRDGYAIAD